MPLVFTPNDSLDIATDPSKLPQAGSGSTIESSAIAQIKNIDIDRYGIATTRKGSAKVNSSAIADLSINHIRVQAGTRYVFSGDDIYQTETSIKSSLTDAQWSSISYNAVSDTVSQIYCLNGTDRKRIEAGVVYEWGITGPTETPTRSFGTGNTLSGTYNGRYTMLRKSGSTTVFESSASAATTSVQFITRSFAMFFTRPNQVDITHVRAYRSTTLVDLQYADEDHATPYYATQSYVYTFSWESTDAYISGTGTPFTTEDVTNTRQYIFSWENDFTGVTSGHQYFAQEQFTHEMVIYDSNAADTSLGELVETNHSRPPTGEFVIGPNYNGTAFIIDNKNLYYCKPRQIEYWPTDYYIEVSTEQFPLQIAVFFNGQPYCLSKNEIYYIQGTGHNTFQPLAMKARTGAQGIYGAYAVDGQGIYHTGTDGLYLFNGNDRKITQNNLNPIFVGSETVGGLPAASNLTTAWIIHYKNKLYFGYTSSGYTYPTNVLVMQLDEPRRVTYYSYPFQIRCVTIDETNDLLLAGCTDGFIRKLQYGTDDSGTAISWVLQSKDFTNPLRKHYPRNARYDVTVDDGSTFTGQILLDGTSIQSHTVTGSREPVKRLIDTDNGFRVAHRLTGTGPVTIYQTEID